ncbi:hypothetical protein [Nocardioides sp. GXZ039]|uniref:hypothetical protein n=1 Tax=Nocardioides sp. GXZ039 TaxID=3136018 RepID=UPI0030F394E4
MKRTALLVTLSVALVVPAPALAATDPGSAVGAPARAVSPAPTVTDADLLTVAQVAKVVPGYTGATRDTYRERRTSLPNPGDCASDLSVPVASARAGVYLPDGSPKVESMLARVDQLGSTAKARALMKKIKRFPSACRSFRQGDQRVRVTRLAAPRVGSDRFGMRLRSSSGSDSFQVDATFVRIGNRLVTVFLATKRFQQRTPYAPLTKMAVRRAR